LYFCFTEETKLFSKRLEEATQILETTQMNSADIRAIIRVAIIISITIAITVVLMLLTKKMLNKQEKRRGKQIHIRFLYNIIRLFIILLAVATIGSQFSGFSSAITTILASSGILALGVSLAAQESLSNIIDGLFISMFKPFNIGDRVTLPEKDNLTGVVSEMNLRHTIITTYQNTSYIVPNSVMSSAIIDNSNFDKKLFGYPIDVSVAYDTDLEFAMSLMVKAITEHPEFVDPRSEADKKAGKPIVTPLCREFGNSGISLRCTMYTKDVSTSFRACSEVRIQLKKLFDENGITIPFTTIHFDNPPQFH